MIAVTLHSAEKERVRFYKVNIPQSWDELTPRQLIGVADILVNERDGYAQDVRLVKMLCDFRRVLFLRIDPEIMELDLIPMIAWIKESCTLTEQKLPCIKIGWNRRLYGPKSFLQNLVFGEFDMAERELYEWSIDPTNKEALYRFVACLYRPRKKKYDLQLDPDGDIRVQFNENLTTYLGKVLMQKLPEATALAIVIWYKGCRNYIVDRFEAVFDQNGVNKSEDPKNPSYYGLMRAIAKEGIYGTFRDVEYMYLYNALHEMTCAIQEAAAMEARLKQDNDQDNDE